MKVKPKEILAPVSQKLNALIRILDKQIAEQKHREYTHYERVRTIPVNKG